MAQAIVEEQCNSSIQNNNVSGEFKNVKKSAQYFPLLPSSTIMPVANSSDSEQKTHRGLKRKTADSFIEHSSSPISRAKRRRSNPEIFTDRAEKHATSSRTPSPDRILFRPDGKFYYDTGDIFLVVERTFFCVHAKKLQAAGGIFEDLLSGNIRPSEEEFLYGLPALNVPLVSLRQFRFFLAHIYGAM